MVMEAAPIAAFVVAEPELLFKLQVIAFDTPAHLDRIDKALEAHLFGQRAQEVFGRVRLALGPLDHQPFLSTQHFAVRHTHAYSREARTEARVRAFSPSDGAVRLRVQCVCDVQSTDGLMS